MARALEPYSPRLVARLYAREAAAFYTTGDALEAEFESLARPAIAHDVAHHKLAWWQEEAARLRANGPRHPLTRALRELGLDGRDSAPVVEAALEVAARRLAGHVPESMAELKADLGDGGSIGARLAVCALPAAAMARARELAGAIGLVGIVSDIRPAARAGDLRLPLAPLRDAGIDPDTLSQGRLPEPVVRLGRELLAEAMAMIDARAAAETVARWRLRALEVEAALWRARATALAATTDLYAAPSHRLEPLKDATRAVIAAWRRG